MDNKEILARINEFVGEEQYLRERYQRDELAGEDEHRRLEQLEVALDQCWDLLRQRRARMDAGVNPDEAQVRPAGEVEGYLQ